MARTSLITAAAIAGVALAGAAAIGANVGILNAAESTEIGTLSAAGDLLPNDPQVVDVYLDDPAATTMAPGAEAADGAAAPAAAAPGAPGAAPSTPAAATAASAPAGAAPAAGQGQAPTAAASSGPNATSQTFAVADAGTVTVSRTSAGLRLGDVAAKPGWTSRATRTEASIVVVSFSSATRTLQLTVTPGPDGGIAGSIAELPVAAPPAPTAQPPQATPTTHPSDDHDDEYEYEAPEHEGGEDDD